MVIPAKDAGKATCVDSSETMTLAPWMPRQSEIDSQIAEFKRCLDWLESVQSGSPAYLEALAWLCLISRNIIFVMTHLGAHSEQAELCETLFLDTHKKTSKVAKNMGLCAKTYVDKLDERAMLIRRAINVNEF